MKQENQKVIMAEWVMKVAQAILNEWSIGTFFNFCDDVDFDSATVDEVAELIWREYQAAQQGFIEGK